ncbi:DNA-binding domain-containing protein, partial [Salmonella enterica]|nr:DNA-binding domain-containing protein [Salmonella enterica]
GHLESDIAAVLPSAESADGASLSPAVRLSEPVAGTLTSALNESIPLTPFVDTSLPGDDKAVHDVMSLMGFSPTPVVEKTPAEQTATTPCTDEGSQNTPSLVPPPGEPDQAPLQATAMALSNISKVASDDSEISEGYGQQLLSWLSEQILSGTLTVNNKDSQIHIVGGLVFLPTPHIFFSFMKEKNYPPDLKNDIQREFERLGLHFMQKGKGVFSCVKYESENRRGRYEKISGYLIKSKLVYASHVIPDDSAYLFVSNRNHRGKDI